MRVFIGGSRRISRLDADVRRRLERIVEQRLHVLVGDANGADKAVQEYLHQKGYPLVEVFCSGTSFRNNRGGWPVRFVEADGRRKDFAFYATKDRVMANEAEIGLMLWDGKSVGTLMNVRRLLDQGKKVVVHVGPRRKFSEVRSEGDWDAFLSGCPPGVRAELERKVAADAIHLGGVGQTSLL